MSLQPHTPPFIPPARAQDGPSAQAMFDVLVQYAEAREQTLRPPPAAPTTCCGRGCNGCVWEGFLDAAEYWRQEALWVLTDTLQNHPAVL